MPTSHLSENRTTLNGKQQQQQLIYVASRTFQWARWEPRHVTSDGYSAQYSVRAATVAVSDALEPLTERIGHIRELLDAERPASQPDANDTRGLD